MATAQQIHRILGKIGSDPNLINKLLAEKGEGKKKEILVAEGLLDAREKGPTRADVEAEIKKLLTPADGAPSPGDGGRVVEWVGAIGSAAGGAAGAACGHE
jgi:hypothetical protein